MGQTNVRHVAHKDIEIDHEIEMDDYNDMIFSNIYYLSKSNVADIQRMLSCKTVSGKLHEINNVMFYNSLFEQLGCIDITKYGYVDVLSQNFYSSQVAQYITMKIFNYQDSLKQVTTSQLSRTGSKTLSKLNDSLVNIDKLLNHIVDAVCVVFLENTDIHATLILYKCCNIVAIIYRSFSFIVRDNVIFVKFVDNEQNLTHRITNYHKHFVLSAYSCV